MPLTTSVDSPFQLSPEQAAALASQFGTPLYVLSEEHLIGTIKRFKTSFAASYPNTQLCYASKANSTLAVISIAYKEGCIIDAASEGEIRAALRAGVSASRIEFHGNNKQPSELRYALDQGVHAINVDHLGEIDMLRDLWRQDATTIIMLRLAPGVDPITHEKISTGQEDTKFGFNIADGSAERALAKALEVGLPVKGFHCHVGSQLMSADAQATGGEALASFAVKMKHKFGFHTHVLNVGGGLGIRYTHHDEPVSLEQYCREIATPIREIVEPEGMMPLLMQEPGRALVGECGVTLYRVGVVKTVPVSSGTRTYIAVDGGLSDNPRPALYGAEYTVKKVGQAREAPMRKVTVSGKHCETDELFPNVYLPEDVAVGDILQVLSTGAYNSSMANNYNRYPRPATVLFRANGDNILVQRRESWDDMFCREMLPSGDAL